MKLGNSNPLNLEPSSPLSPLKPPEAANESQPSRPALRRKLKCVWPRSTPGDAAWVEGCIWTIHQCALRDAARIVFQACSRRDRAG